MWVRPPPRAQEKDSRQKFISKLPIDDFLHNILRKFRVEKTSLLIPKVEPKLQSAKRITRLFLFGVLSTSLIGFNTPQSNASDPPAEPDCFTVNVSGENSETRTVIDGYSCTGSVVIPSGVTSIGNSAFQGAAGLTDITIPSSVTSIGDSAFQGTTSLASISLPNSVTSIGSNAFQDATALTSITIPNGVTEIADWTFFRATSLTFVGIPSTVTSIGSRAFRGATALASITIPNSVTSIGTSAFEDASALTGIIIPNGVTEIGAYTFYRATSLTHAEIPSSVTSIGIHAFLGATALSSVRFLGAPPTLSTEVFHLVDPDAKALVNRSKLESFTAADDYPLDEWAGLTLEVYTFPTGDLSCLEKVSTSIFSGVDCVGPITIPNTTTSLQDNSFFNAESLTSITLPSTLTSIGARAFESATSLSLVRLMGAAPSVGVDAFLNVASGITARIDQVHQSSYVLVDGLWNGLVLEVIIPPVSNTTTSGSTALDREIERLREAEKKLARDNLVTLVKESAPLTLDLFNQASISGVTAKNFAGVAAEIAELPIDRRSQIDEILKVARKFEVVDKVASSDRIYSSMLQEVGLISQDSKHKAALTAALRKLPASERTSYLAIKQAIDAQMAEIQTRKTRLSEVVAQIAARRKG